MLFVVSSPSPLPSPPSSWRSLLLVACHSRRNCHRPRHRCDRGRSPSSAMLPPAMRRVLTKDIRRLGGWLSPRRRASPLALSTLGTTINARRCTRCACPSVDPFLTCLGRYLLNGSNRFVRRWRVIADVTLVRSNFYLLFLHTSTRHLKVGQGQEDCVGT
jgi:hypothetical protein